MKTKTRRNHLSGLAAALVLLAGATLTQTAHAQIPSYTAIDLGTIGGTHSQAYGINISSQVVGLASTTGNSAEHATLYSNTPGNSGNIDLGTLGGNSSTAYAINAAGQIVGNAEITEDIPFFYHATLFSNTPGNEGNIDLGTLGGSISLARAINASGQIVGFAYTSGGIIHATLFSNTPGNEGNIDLGTLGGTTSNAIAINAAGQIVGVAQPTDSPGHATLFSSTPGNEGNINLGTLGGDYSTAFAINAAGQIVGSAGTTGNSAERATLFSNTPGNEGNIDLGTLGGNSSIAYGINASGQIVGDAQIADASFRGFLYSGGVMSNINDLVLPGSGITNIQIGLGSINDWGQIVAQGNVGINIHAVLLNPVDPLSTTTPTSNNTKFVAGMDYDKFASLTNPGGDGTTAALLGGSASTNRDVTVAFTGEDNSGLASDIVSLTGTFDDLIVLSLSYDDSLFGDDVHLGWLDDGQWTLAVAGNTGPENTPTFIEGAYDPEAHFQLGYYGVNADTHTAWAVINHNSDFAVINTVPEPGTCALIGLGLAACLLRKRRTA